MNALVWNLTIIAGVTLVGVGVGLSDGIPRALIVVGALVLALNVVTAFVAGRSR